MMLWCSILFLHCLCLQSITLKREQGSSTSQQNTTFEQDWSLLPEPQLSHGVKGWSFKYGFASRWQKPSPLKIQGQNGSLNGVKCMQMSSKGTLQGQEDCLYLSVFTPDTESFVSLPVVVIFHPGGFVRGQRFGAPEVQWVVKAGIIAVTVNYRLGAFGFFPHPTVEEPNLGIADQTLALDWVQENIGLFRR